MRKAVRSPLNADNPHLLGTNTPEGTPCLNRQGVPSFAKPKYDTLIVASVDHREACCHDVLCRRTGLFDSLIRLSPAVGEGGGYADRTAGLGRIGTGVAVAGILAEGNFHREGGAAGSGGAVAGKRMVSPGDLPSSASLTASLVVTGVPSISVMMSPARIPFW